MLHDPCKPIQSRLIDETIYKTKLTDNLAQLTKAFVIHPSVTIFLSLYDSRDHGSDVADIMSEANQRGSPGQDRLGV